MLLENRIAIVTGGSSGIGRGIAIEFAREGARVVVTDIQEAPSRGKYHEQNTITPTVDEIEKLGAQGLFVKTDIADDVQVDRLIQKTVEHFGGLDILVNNAGIHIPGNSQELSIADWDKVVSVDLRSIFVATKIAIPHLRSSEFGRIIQIASVNAYGGGAGPAYAPAKAAVVNKKTSPSTPSAQATLKQLFKTISHRNKSKKRGKGPLCRVLACHGILQGLQFFWRQTMRNGLQEHP